MIADLFNLLWLVAKWAGLGLLALYVLWVYFLAVMKLRDIRDAPKLYDQAINSPSYKGELDGVKRPKGLVGPIKYPAYLVLVIGYLWDAFCNLGPMSLFLLELPQLQLRQGLQGFFKESEWTVSARTKRHAKEATRRGALSRWMRTIFLAPADLKGGHD